MNHKIMKYLSCRFLNLSIYKKLLLIMGILTLTLLLTALTAVQLTFAVNQKLLYSSISSLMRNSAREISSQISDSVELTQSMLSNPDLQSDLSRIKDSDSSITPVSSSPNFYQNLSKLIYDYYYTYPSKNISYIALTNGSFTLSTYNKGNRLSSSILQDIIQRAEKASGNPVLITEYAQDYGIFLARTIRRIDSLQLDSLGTILVSIDIASLIQDATKTISLTEEVSYILSEDINTTPFFSTLDSEETVPLLSDKTNYGVCRLDKNKYFTVKGIIPYFQWKYYCLIEYNTILSSLSYTKIFCFLLIFVSTCVLFLLSQKIVRSLTRHLLSLADKMTAFGKDDSRVPVSSYDYTSRLDEIGILHNQFDIMAHKIQTLINENYRNELLKKDMLLKNLQNQINPHFLYNTLESINWRAKASGEKEISQITESLGSLLRTSLTPSSCASTVKTELNLVRDYIAIQKIRFDGRLDYSEALDPNAMVLEIPLLSIQPLVENAVRYGLEENIGSCAISVSVFLENSNLIIQVLNEGSQFEADTMEKLLSNQIIPHGFGIGILNIQKRIQMIYGEEYGIRLENPDEEHAMSELVLPGPDKQKKGELS